MLIVDDDPDDRLLIKERLTRCPGITVQIHEAERGEHGLELVRAVDPDIVLLDFRMPDIDGLEFLRRLGSETGRVTRPIVMLTSEGDDRVALTAMTRGASDFVLKHAATSVLLEHVVVRALQRKRAEEEFLRNTLYDPLTGQAGDVLLRERLAHMLDRLRRYRNDAFALLRVRVRGVDEAGKAYGYGRADALRIQATERMACFAREGDTLTRLRASEFALALEHAAGLEDGRLVASRIVDAFKPTFPDEEGAGPAVKLSVSIGIVAGDPDIPDVDALMTLAEEAMGAADRCGFDHVAWVSPGAADVVTAPPR